MTDQPLVTVVTPVYNGEAYLVECIESVLKQTYKNFEYIIVNNCSTDRSLEIALEYERKDRRIRVYNNKLFVGSIANHNIAFSRISPESRYCKVVSADDFIFPECLAHMVDLGESNPSVGIIGCYQLSEDRIRWGGFKYPLAVVSGRELGRRIFLESVPTFGFGSPTSLMYRADLVRDEKGFYPNDSPHADTSACFKSLPRCDFGFAYQVLSFERIHVETESHRSKQLNKYSSAYLNDLITYGPFYLDQRELTACIKKTLKSYHRHLGINYLLGSGGKEYWDYHKQRLNELGFPLTRFQLISSVVTTVLREMANPKRAIGRMRHHLFPEPTAESQTPPHSPLP